MESKVDIDEIAFYGNANGFFENSDEKLFELTAYQDEDCFQFTIRADEDSRILIIRIDNENALFLAKTIIQIHKINNKLCQD